MTVRDKLRRINKNIISVGMYDDNEFNEYLVNDIPNNTMNRDIEHIEEFDTPTYIEISMK